VLTHEQMLVAVWGAEYTDSVHKLQHVMTRLWQRLDAALGTSLFQTLPGVGYRFRGA
jgi:DNA-binding response OmpR family regulator